MNANLRVFYIAVLILLCTIQFASPSQAQSNATDSTFFPMHQGNRWVFTYWDGIYDYGHWVLDIKEPVECIDDLCMLSLEDSNRMAFIAVRSWPLTWEHNNTIIEYNLLENILYYRISGDSIATPALYFGEEVGFKWDMGYEIEEAPNKLVREIIRIDTLFDSSNDLPVVQYVISQYGVVNGVYWGSVNNAYFVFRKGVGMVNYAGCLDCFLAQITAARINGETLFGDISVSNEDDRSDSPDALRLDAAYPNPFNPTTTLRFALGHTDDVSLTVYDVLGRQVHRQEYGVLHAGVHHRTLDLGGHSGGIYLVRLRSGLQVRSTLITLVK
jgi:hypothetical protein